MWLGSSFFFYGCLSRQRPIDRRGPPERRAGITHNRRLVCIWRVIAAGREQEATACHDHRALYTAEWRTVNQRRPPLDAFRLTPDLVSLDSGQ